MSIEKQIYTRLKDAGFSESLALMIVAQSKYETSVAGVPYTSRVFLLNNNAFGYKYVKGNKWATNGTQSPEGNAYAKYATLDDCLSDIIGWYKRRFATFAGLTNLDAFANALKTAGYFGQTAKEYAAGARKFYKTSIV